MLRLLHGKLTSSKSDEKLDSLAVMSTFFHESNCHSIQPIVTYMKGKKCVPNNFARFCKDIKHFMAVHGESLKRFLLFYKSSSVVASSSPYNWL